MSESALAAEASLGDLQPVAMLEIGSPIGGSGHLARPVARAGAGFLARCPAFCREPAVHGRALFFLFLSNVLGGASFAAMQLARAGLPEITILELRLVVALFCLAPLLGRDSLRWPYDRRDTLRLVLTGTLGFAAPLALGILGLRYSTSTNASILILLEPIGIVLLARLFLKERAALGQTLGMLLGLGGATLVVLGSGGDASLLAGSHLLGNLMLAVHGLMWSVYTIAAKPVLERHGSRPVTYHASWVALLALAPFVPFELRGRPLFHGPALPSLLWVAALGLGVSFAGTYLWIKALAVLRPIVIAVFVFVQPLVGALLGRIVFDDPAGPGTLVGGLMIGLAVLAIAAPEARRGRGADPRRRAPPRPSDASAPDENVSTTRVA